MNKKIPQIVSCTAMAGLLFVITGCCHFRSCSKRSPKVVIEPQTQIVKINDPVKFAVVVPKDSDLQYQWQFNGTNIPGATNAYYKIPHRVNFPDAGEYKVWVGNEKWKVSTKAFLSVYGSASAQDFSSGTLVTPIGIFGSQTFKCGLGSFNRAYCPANTSGAVALFYGPNATGQSGPFQNLTGATKLTLDTFDCANDPADTGIMIQNNFVPKTTDCNDNSPTAPACHKTGGKLGPVTLSTAAGGINSKNTYRVTVLYKDPPGAPPGKTITFNWKYSN